MEINEIFNVVNTVLSMLANVFAIGLGIHSVYKIVSFSKRRKETTSNTYTINRVNRITNVYQGFSDINFINHGELTSSEIDNYDYRNEQIWKKLWYFLMFVILYFLVQYWFIFPIHLELGTFDENWNSFILLGKKVLSCFAFSFQKTSVLVWLGQLVTSICVMIKMYLTKDILYRKTNFLLYGISIVATSYLLIILSKINFINLNYNLLQTATTEFSLESLNPLLNLYALIVLFVQLIYIFYILYSGIKIIRIGELQYHSKRTQAEKVNKEKRMLLIFPVILIVIWNVFVFLSTK